MWGCAQRAFFPDPIKRPRCQRAFQTQVLVFVASIAVMLICHFRLSSIDEEYANKNAGYWPERLDWTAPSKSDEPGTKR